MFNKSLVFTLSLAIISFQGIAQTERPNIIIILADDMGYSDIGCFGSEIQTPNLDEMAKRGLKMTQFYNASRCCPTRASLLTGLYQHQAGIGDMMNTRPYPAYQGFLNKNSVTIAEALKVKGYNTYMAGKWHVGQAKEHWPLRRGFDRYYGLIDGASSYFGLYPYRPNQKLSIVLDDSLVTPGPNYYSTDSYTDHAIEFIEEGKLSQKPFFLYLAYQAPHWPLHALPEDIVKYKGKYMKGWDKLREERFVKMKAMGLINQDTKLSPRDSNIPDWNSLSRQEKEEWDEKMAVYSAMIDRMDQNIGRLRNKLLELGIEKNTVIMFLSDNGGSNESINGQGFLPEIIEASKKSPSDPTSFTSYGYPGANVSNTPFRSFKHWEYEGGTATPFIAYSPSKVKAGKISSQPGHIIDLMATCLELAGAEYPKSYKGNKIKESKGVSLAPLFKGLKWKGHDAIFFEHEGNRAVRKDNWKLVSAFPENRWQLYDLSKDRSELNDLSARYPEKVKQMSELYDTWSKEAEVIPFEKLVTREKR
jgi:arylsulfatase A-like enzyme